MRSFDYSYLSERTWDAEILSYISRIHEYKGKQELFLRQKPVELKRLVEIAKVQSTEASNRIEGIVTTNARLKQLVTDKTTPRNRDEEEILGYRNMLNTVHENYDMIPVRSSYILQMHRDLMKFTNYDIVKAYIREQIGKFTKQDVLAGCPSLGSSSVEASLKRLVDDGTLVRIGAGRKTQYVRTDAVR